MLLLVQVVECLIGVAYICICGPSLPTLPHFFAWWKAANSHFMPYKRWTPWLSYQSLLRETLWCEFEPLWSKLKLTSYLRCLGLHARTVHVIVSFRSQTPISLQPSILQHISFPLLVPQRYVLISFGIKKPSRFKGEDAILNLSK